MECTVGDSQFGGNSNRATLPSRDVISKNAAIDVQVLAGERERAALIAAVESVADGKTVERCRFDHATKSKDAIKDTGIAANGQLVFAWSIERQVAIVNLRQRAG